MKKEEVERLAVGSLVAYQHGVTQEITAGPDEHGLLTIVAVTTAGRSERKMARANFLDEEWRMAAKMTVGDLRRALDGLADDMTVMVEVFDEGRDEHAIAALHFADVEGRCDDDIDALYLGGNGMGR